MRDYDEVTQTVLRRRDEQLARDRRKAIILRRSAAAALSVCAAAVIGISVFGRGAEDIEFNGGDTGVSETTSAAVTGYVITETEPSSHETAVTYTTVSAVQTTGVSGTHAPAATTGASLTASGTAIHTTSVNTRPAAAAAVTTLSMTQAPPAAVTTTTVYDDERSYSMRKLMPFAAAIAVLSNAGAVSVNAAIGEIPKTRLQYDEVSLFAAMDDGEVQTDINCDGKFDLRDCYDFLGVYLEYDYSDEIRENVQAIGDYDGDGYVGYYDAEKLLRYYLVNNPITNEYFTAEFYKPWEKTKTINGGPIYGPAHPEAVEELNSEDFDKSAYTPEELEELLRLADEQTIIGYESVENHLSETFVSEMINCSRGLSAQYPLFVKNVNDGIFDLDIDSDGVVTYEDINIFTYYRNDQKAKHDRIERNHQWIESLLPIDLDPEGLLELREPDFETSITDDQWEKCVELENWYYNLYRFEDLDQYAIWYLFERDGMPDEKYMDNDYYESILPGSGAVWFGAIVNKLYNELFPVSEKMRLDQAELSKYINPYCDNVVAGNIVPPDANGDGVLNFRDILISDMYLRDCKNDVSRENSIIPESVWDFFETQLDLNENGVCGDICDVSIYQTSIYAYCDFIEGAERTPEYDHEGYVRFFNEYSDELRAAKLGSAQAAPAAVESNLSELRTNAAIKRSGDSNCDGTVDLADAIFIMQSMANPDKYKLSELGKFNADVCETGGGITAGDALAIQEGLLRGEY